MAASISKTVWSKEVYEPSDDTFLLVDTLIKHADNWKQVPKPLTFVEIGCGSGFVSCSLAAILKELGIGAHIIAIDINPAAAKATHQTMMNHSLQADVCIMDLVEGLSQHWLGSIDVIVFNPPYVPTPDAEVEQDGIARAWAGGEKGRRVIDRLLKQLPDILSPNGELIMVTIAQNEPEQIFQDMEARGFKGKVLGNRQADEESLSIIHLSRR